METEDCVKIRFSKTQHPLLCEKFLLVTLKTKQCHLADYFEQHEKSEVIEIMTTPSSNEKRDCAFVTFDDQGPTEKTVAQKHHPGRAPLRTKESATSSENQFHSAKS